MDMKLIKSYINSDKKQLTEINKVQKMLDDQVPVNTIIKHALIPNDENYQFNYFDTHRICTKSVIVRATKKAMTDKFANEHVYTDNAKRKNRKAYELATKLDPSKFYYINYNVEYNQEPSFRVVNAQLLQKAVSSSYYSVLNEYEDDVADLAYTPKQSISTENAPF